MSVLLLAKPDRPPAGKAKIFAVGRLEFVSICSSSFYAAEQHRESKINIGSARNLRNLHSEKTRSDCFLGDFDLCLFDVIAAVAGTLAALSRQGA
jgi:hypothetical protein